MLPKAVTPSNKHTLCQWLFLWPPIDCVILSLWKNTSSGTINYKLLLHTSRAWCCLHPAVLNRPQQGRAEEQRKGTTKMNSASSSSINYLVQNGLYMCPTLKLIEEILIVVVRRRNLLTSMPRCQLMQKNIFLHRAFFVPMLWCFAAFSSRLIGIISFSCLAVFCALTKLPGF